MKEQYITKKELERWFAERLASAYRYSSAKDEYIIALELVKHLMIDPWFDEDIFKEMERKRVYK